MFPIGYSSSRYIWGFGCIIILYCTMHGMVGDYTSFKGLPQVCIPVFEDLCFYSRLLGFRDVGNLKPGWWTVKRKLRKERNGRIQVRRGEREREKRMERKWRNEEREEGKREKIRKSLLVLRPQTPPRSSLRSFNAMAYWT